MTERLRIAQTHGLRLWFPLLLGLLLPVLGACHRAPSRTSIPVGGLPQTSAQVTVLDNHHFWVGYSRARQDPLWVLFQARVPPHYHRLGSRPKFRQDKRVPGSAKPDAIYGRYDHGHMAPNYIIGTLYGRAAQLQTFLMTNITPQRPRLNQLLWQRIEEVEADDMTPKWGPMWVVTGPIFGQHPQHLDSGVAIPAAFYRIWLRYADNGQPQMLAFRVPQSVRGDEPLTKFLTSVDKIEAATGLDFFPKMPSRLQRRVESRVASPAAWGLAALACTPARYRKHWRGRGGIHLNFDRCDTQR